MTPVKMFYKKGGVKQAETDFQDLNPTGVKEIAVCFFHQLFSGSTTNVIGMVMGK